MNNKDCEALYIINKYAKKYEKLYKSSNNNYLSDRYIIKRDSLYKLKNKIIESNIEKFDDVFIHSIHNEEYYYLVVNDWKYHVPKEEVYVEQEIKNKEYIKDFQSNSNLKGKELMTLKESLTHFSRKGYNINNYVPNTQNVFSGWNIKPVLKN